LLLGRDSWQWKSWVEFRATMLINLYLLVHLTGWILDVCSPSLFICTKSHILLFMTIVEHIQNILMAAGAFIPPCIVMTIHNAVWAPRQGVVWNTTLLLAGMRALFFFVSNLTTCYLSISTHVNKYDKDQNEITFTLFLTFKVD
jgi:hypothetical protein